MTEWNLKLLYKSDNDPEIEKDIKKSQDKVATFISHWKENKKYTKDPKVLKKALDEYEELSRTTGVLTKPYYYFILRKEQNQTDEKIKEKFNKIVETARKLENELIFFDLNISKIPEEEQNRFLNSSELKEYKHFLEESFASAKYLLSDKEEKVFNLLSKPAYGNWADMVEELLNKQTAEILEEDGTKKTVSYNQIFKYFTSRNKKVRDIAAKEFNKINEKYLEIAEFEMNSLLEAKKIGDDYRKIPRPDMATHLKDDIDTEVVDALIETVTKNFHISREFYKQKAKKLGVKKLQYYEKSVPVYEDKQEFTYEQSMDIVKETFGKLDDDFLKIVKYFQDDGHYDVYPNSGKGGGAFCISVGKEYPTYILLNHKNKLNDVLTIAHETGHGIHSELSNIQNELNNDYPTSLAEVASTFFEDFVFENVLESQTDEDIKNGILTERIEGDISTIFRQVAFYNFEKDLHKDFREKGFLSKEYISDLFCKHMKAYMGDAVEVDDSMRYGWIYVGHFRRFFYVYSYASGQLISKSLQSLVRDDIKNIDKVKTFLSSGSSLSPKDLFMSIGIDISKKDFWQRGIDEIEKELNKLK